jgi:hypothetical protein
MSSPGSFYSLSDEPARRLVLVNERYTCGDRYEGTVYMGAKGAKVKHGSGRYEFSNGSYYKGDWHEGSMSGKGTFWESTTGDRFDGEWRDGKRVCGVYYFSDGDLYVGGFDDATGHLKQGRAVVVEAMTPYDAEYRDDAIVRKTPFQTSVQPHARPQSTSGGSVKPRSVQQHQQTQLEAAKSILRSRREEVSGNAEALPVSHNDSQMRQFGLLQRGQSARFMHPRPQDAKDAVRFHHR